MSNAKVATASTGDALVAVDVQRDFLPGGALGVPDGNAVIPALSRYIRLFLKHKLPIIATRDWHPEDHCSFKPQGGPWPPHCIAGSPGAELAEELDLENVAMIVSKAATKDKDAYSGFDGTNLHAQLKAKKIVRLFIGGLATDYCVLNTARDAITLGYKVFLLVDAIRAVDVNAGDGDRAIAEMKKLGAVAINSEQLA